MDSSVNSFHGKYNVVITKLLQEQLTNFSNINDVDERIKLLYPYLQSIKLDIVNSEKCYEDALKYKLSGNKFYLEKENWKAIECYNKGILACPQNNSDTLETFSILIANRSACFFDVQRYSSALGDISYALSTNSYPQKLSYKLYIRKAKCQLWTYCNTSQILDSYKLAQKHLKHAQLNEKEKELKRNEIGRSISELKGLGKNNWQNLVAVKSFEKCNSLFLHANEAVDFKYKPGLGRFAVATKDIDAGIVVVDEPAHCAVLISDYNLTNCHNCTVFTDAPFACSTCNNVIFCSLNCVNAAKVYHKYECGFLKTLYDSGASVNCHMALRIISQQPLEALKFLSKDNSCTSIYSLCRNDQQRKIEGYFHYTIMSIFLMRLLKTSSYFDLDCDDTILTENEIFVARLMIKHLEILEFNAHEISELREVSQKSLSAACEDSFNAVFVGGGLYPTAALFNHSCDPSVVRYNIGSRLIVKTIKPIRKNDIIYENYGPIYTNIPKQERRAFLQERYWFTCACQACTEDWPLFKCMKDDAVKIRCNTKHCSGGIYIQDAFIQSFCSQCNKSINPLPHLKALSELEVILPKAEGFYQNKNYKEAAKIYTTAMNIYYKHTTPPFPDWVKVQQRLRTCMVTEGNKNDARIT